MWGTDQTLAGPNTPRGGRASSNEQPAPAAGMPADVREFLVAKLAEILVLDVQQYPAVPVATVVEGGVSHRTIRRVGSRTQTD